MTRIESYLNDTWQSGREPMIALVNPATEETLAETSTEGLDFSTALAFARDVGGPSLRALGFEGRSTLLEEMSRLLYEQRERLIEISIANGGNTRGDAKFDIDGATGALTYYSQLGSQLGTGNALWDGESEQLARSPRFHGRHLMVPLRGAAVHIGAFNFPAWGTFEKAAVALLAGVPVVSKPATSSCLLTWEMTRILVDSGILPAGSFQLVTGSARDLVDGLGGQDTLAFTGSADTGARLRAAAGPVHKSTRINIEADSLNAAILGPSVETGTTVWDAFIQGVVSEMTQKAGQKCTAIRRIIVPTSQIDNVQEALCAELAEVKVGNPALEEVRMGPLATAAQLEDYRAGVASLAEQARIVFGDPTRVDTLGVPVGKGYFAAPVLLRAENALAAHEVHRREVFGPVATLLPYDGSVAEAVEIVARGGGSLVSSVFATDRDFLSSVLPELAPYNGRILAIDPKVAEVATPHGTVLPSVVHGGPGRAGGGEELGGRRGLSFYMQRSGLTGNRALIDKIV